MFSVLSGTSITVEPLACFAGTSEAGLGGAAESVVLQGAVRVHTFVEVHAVYASSDPGMPQQVPTQSRETCGP